MPLAPTRRCGTSGGLQIALRALREPERRLFRAIEAGDIDAVGSLYAAEVEVWHNTDQVAQDREANLATLGWVMHNLTGLRYTQIRRQATVGGFVQQHVLTATSRAGRDVAVPVCIVATVRQELISRIDEYLDSAGIALLSEPATAGSCRTAAAVVADVEGHVARSGPGSARERDS